MHSIKQELVRVMIKSTTTFGTDWYRLLLGKGCWTCVVPWTSLPSWWIPWLNSQNDMIKCINKTHRSHRKPVLLTMTITMMAVICWALMCPLLFSFSRVLSHFSPHPCELGICILSIRKWRHGEVKYEVSGDKYCSSKGNSKARSSKLFRLG